MHVCWLRQLRKLCSRFAKITPHNCNCNCNCKSKLHTLDTLPSTCYMGHSSFAIPTCRHQIVDPELRESPLLLAELAHCLPMRKMDTTLDSYFKVNLPLVAPKRRLSIFRVPALVSRALVGNFSLSLSLDLLILILILIFLFLFAAECNYCTLSVAQNDHVLSRFFWSGNFCPTFFTCNLHAQLAQDGNISASF